MQANMNKLTNGKSKMYNIKLWLTNMWIHAADILVLGFKGIVGCLCCGKQDSGNNIQTPESRIITWREVYTRPWLSK